MRTLVAALLVPATVLSASLTRGAGNLAPSRAPHAWLKTVGLGDARWKGGFWDARFDICTRAMIPAIWAAPQMLGNGATFRNLLIAAGRARVHSFSATGRYWGVEVGAVAGQPAGRGLRVTVFAVGLRALYPRIAQTLHTNPLTTHPFDSAALASGPRSAVLPPEGRVNEIGKGSVPRGVTQIKTVCHRKNTSDLVHETLNLVDSLADALHVRAHPLLQRDLLARSVVTEQPNLGEAWRKGSAGGRLLKLRWRKNCGCRLNPCLRPEPRQHQSNVEGGAAAIDR